MKKFFLAIIVAQAIPVYADSQESPPTFSGDQVVMAAKTIYCGGVRFKPKSGKKVRVRSQRFEEGLFSSIVRPGDILSDWVELPRAGIRVRYDRAGMKPSAYYGIDCEAQSERGHWGPVACSVVLDIVDVKHNKGCVVGPLGPEADYPPLNMSTSAKKVK